MSRAKDTRALMVLVHRGCFGFDLVRGGSGDVGVASAMKHPEKRQRSELNMNTLTAAPHSYSHSDVTHTHTHTHTHTWLR